MESHEAVRSVSQSGKKLWSHLEAMVRRHPAQHEDWGKVLGDYNSCSNALQRLFDCSDGKKKQGESVLKYHVFRPESIPVERDPRTQKTVKLQSKIPDLLAWSVDAKIANSDAALLRKSKFRSRKRSYSMTRGQADTAR